MKLGYVILYVENVEASITFYENAFSIKRKFIHESKEYGEMETGDTILSFADRSTSQPKGLEFLKNADTSKCHPTEIAFITEDVPSAFEKAIRNGCKIISEPEQKPWSQLVSYVLDLNGFLVELSSPVA